MENIREKWLRILRSPKVSKLDVQRYKQDLTAYKNNVTPRTLKQQTESILYDQTGV